MRQPIGGSLERLNGRPHFFRGRGYVPGFVPDKPSLGLRAPSFIDDLNQPGALTTAQGQLDRAVGRRANGRKLRHVKHIGDGADVVYVLAPRILVALVLLGDDQNLEPASATACLDISRAMNSGNVSFGKRTTSRASKSGPAQRSAPPRPEASGIGAVAFSINAARTFQSLAPRIRAVISRHSEWLSVRPLGARADRRVRAIVFASRKSRMGSPLLGGRDDQALALLTRPLLQRGRSSRYVRHTLGRKQQAVSAFRGGWHVQKLASIGNREEVWGFVGFGRGRRAERAVSPEVHSHRPR